jgi:hypothetical protein
MPYNLQQRLNAFVSGECSPEAFMQELVVFCDASPDSAWDVLALIDQYHRLGKLSVNQYRTISQRIERHVLLVANDPAIAADRQEPASPSLQPMHKIPPSVSDKHNTRAKLQRYRRRISTLAEIGRRYRGELAKAQSELVSARAEAARYREPGQVSERGHRRLLFSTAAGWILLALILVVLPPFQVSPPSVVVLQTPPPVAAAPIPPAPEPAVLSLSSDRYVVLPGQTQATIFVQRTGGGRGGVNFVWRARASGARPGKDFRFGKPKSAQLPDGTDSLQLPIPILHNPLRKHTEMFYVEIRNPGDGAALGAITRATVFILPAG